MTLEILESRNTSRLHNETTLYFLEVLFINLFVKSKSWALMIRNHAVLYF